MTGTKVVVRLLPPRMSESELFESNGKKLSYVQGKERDKQKNAINSRAYIQFLTREEADTFIKTYHGWPCPGEKNEVYRAVVCMAPYQTAPRGSKKSSDRLEDF
eukprot:GHVL01042003.1.p1 GENE.GHVL01042003.1~~GHVL01042003.1.p1  ORF type:complete len:104 (+),score=22.03 GHVL01042003.1:58-369(+)